MSRLLVVVGVLTLLSACSTDTAVQPTTQNYSVDTTGSVHLAMGVPIDSDSTDDYLILRYQYAVSYNPTLNVPNWVAWKLSKDWYGDVSRYSGNFISDTSLPASMYRVKHTDYSNSGYDRGHMVRSEERTATAEDKKSTFLLTSILQQRPDLNRGDWLKFEYWCEGVRNDSIKKLYVEADDISHEPPDQLRGVVVAPI